MPAVNDTLSDVLRAVRLKGAVFFDVDTTAPWVAEAPASKAIASAVLPESQHVIEYHVVTSGSCWATVVGADLAPVYLQEGDVVAFPQGDPHVVSSAPGMRGAEDIDTYIPESVPNLPLVMNLDGGGTERTHLVCGFLGCDVYPFNPLLDSLPRILHIRATDTARSTWLKEFTRFAVLEASAKREGASGILSKLGELMFVEVVRRYIELLPEGSKGWLGGLRDRHVGRALNLLHAQPMRDWTLDLLAKEAGLSRSSFADRFTSYVGIPPMQYLQRWRLQMAASKLADGTASIAQIAAETGYESEAAFSRAFKKFLGDPPAEWRNNRTQTRGAAPPKQ
jgi:AraC-like DNA-binding protein